MVALDLKSLTRRIARYWDTGELPADMQGVQRSWPDMHAVHGQELYADSLAREFLRKRCRPAALRACLRAREPAQKAGISRLHACGFWFDADGRCLERIESIVPPHLAFHASGMSVS